VEALDFDRFNVVLGLDLDLLKNERIPRFFSVVVFEYKSTFLFNVST